MQIAEIMVFKVLPTHFAQSSFAQKTKLFRKLQTSFVFFHYFHIVRTSVSSVDILCHFVVDIF